MNITCPRCGDFVSLFRGDGRYKCDSCQEDFSLTATLTLRDQFAMAALTGLLSTVSSLSFKDGKAYRNAIAVECYRFSDEMLAVGNQKS